MGDTIKFKKGLKENLPTLGIGEPGFTTNVDDQRMYIGGPNGNVAIPNMEDIDVINSQMNDNTQEIQKLNAYKTSTDLNNEGEVGKLTVTKAVSTTLNTPNLQGLTGALAYAIFTYKNNADYGIQVALASGSNDIFIRKYSINGWGLWVKNLVNEDSGWIDLVLLNGVTATVTPQYRKIGNVVYIRGSINNISADNITFANIPQGFRFVGGGTQRVFNLPLGGTKIAKISIDNGGNCKFLMTNADHNIGNNYVLDNIIYIIN